MPRFLPFLALAAWAYASPLPNADADASSTSKVTVYQTCHTPGTFALTFDDGPYIYEKQLTDFLSKNGVHSTFFVNGNNWDCIYDRAEYMQQAYQEGHEFGSHTWSHADITKLSFAQLQQEMGKVEVALGKILGIKPNLFRPPYGSYNAASLANLAKLNYTNAILWSFDSGDSTGATTSQSKAAYQKYVSSLNSKSVAIALNHEPYEGTVETVIPYAVNLIQQKGLKMTTISQCLGIPAYKSATGVMGKRDSTWKC